MKIPFGSEKISIYSKGVMPCAISLVAFLAFFVASGLSFFTMLFAGLSLFCVLGFRESENIDKKRDELVPIKNKEKLFGLSPVDCIVRSIDLGVPNSSPKIPSLIKKHIKGNINTMSVSRSVFLSGSFASPGEVEILASEVVKPNVSIRSFDDVKKIFSRLYPGYIDVVFKDASDKSKKDTPCFGVRLEPSFLALIFGLFFVLDDVKKGSKVSFPKTLGHSFFGFNAKFYVCESVKFRPLPGSHLFVNESRVF